MKINEISFELIPDMSFAKYRTRVTGQGKKTAIRVGEKIDNGVSNETLPPYPFLSLKKKLYRIIQIT